jgi:Ni,Fe-hydrogenase III component G
MRKILSAVAVLVLILTGCATEKQRAGAESGQGPLSVALLTEREVKDSYGWSLLDNPYLSYSGTIFPRVYDFLVFKLAVNFPVSTQLELLDADAENADGKVKAPFYDSDRFKTVTMSSVANQESSGSFSQRENKITWNYLPQGTLTLKPGKHSYVFVLVGKHPLPDSLTAHIRLSVNGEEQDFDIPLPDAQD